MKPSLYVSDQAQADADQIFVWLARRSMAGAIRWHNELEAILQRIQQAPLQFAITQEYPSIALQLREATFRTRRGRKYRVLFVFERERVEIVTIRGSGQRPPTRME